MNHILIVFLILLALGVTAVLISVFSADKKPYQSAYIQPATCNNGICTPNCVGKTCGADGCGASCGTCAAGQVCSNGNCVDSSTCVGSCAGKQCGDNGCGASCGTCPVGEVCSNGICMKSTCIAKCEPDKCGTDGCGGNCICSEEKVCKDGSCITVCKPNCGDKVCGDDGCGASCGNCPAGQVCDNGVCVVSQQAVCNSNNASCGGVVTQDLVQYNCTNPCTSSGKKCAINNGLKDIPTTDKYKCANIGDLCYPANDQNYVYKFGQNAAFSGDKIDCLNTGVCKTGYFNQWTDANGGYKLQNCVGPITTACKLTDSTGKLVDGTWGASPDPNALYCYINCATGLYRDPTNICKTCPKVGDVCVPKNTAGLNLAGLKSTYKSTTAALSEFPVSCPPMMCVSEPSNASCTCPTSFGTTGIPQCTYSGSKGECLINNCSAAGGYLINPTKTACYIKPPDATSCTTAAGVVGVKFSGDTTCYITTREKCKANGGTDANCSKYPSTTVWSNFFCAGKRDQITPLETNCNTASGYEYPRKQIEAKMVCTDMAAIRNSITQPGSVQYPPSTDNSDCKYFFNPSQNSFGCQYDAATNSCGF